MTSSESFLISLPAPSPNLTFLFPLMALNLKNGFEPQARLSN